MGGGFETTLLALAGTLVAGVLMWMFLPAEKAGAPGRWLFRPRPVPPVLVLCLVIAVIVALVLQVRAIR